MLKWILKTLWRQKGTVTSSAGGVAFAFVLVVIMEAAFVGESNQIVAYIRHANADVWVMQKGVSNMHMATTFVWDWKAKRIAELPGVKKATPILYVNTGPWSMAAGNSQPGPGEIVLPDVLAKMTGIKLGDQARIADKEFIVSGFSNETFSMANSIAFVHFRDLEDLISTSGTVSFILVDLEPGQDKTDIIRQIEKQVEKVNAVSQEQFIKNDFQIALLMGVEVVSFMSIIGTILAALIIAFAAYSQVSRRKRELAIAKALGYRNHSLYLAVLIQTLVITGLALLIAFLIATFLLPLLSSLVPQITLVVTTSSLLRLTIIAFIVAIVAAIVPARMIANIDPLTAFRTS